MLAQEALSLLAAAIVTGNASAVSNVSTNVSTNVSSETVETSITTVVNGQTSTVESNQPGKIEVKASEEGLSVKTDGEITPTVSVNYSKNAFEKLSIFFERLFLRLKGLWTWSIFRERP